MLFSLGGDKENPTTTTTTTTTTRKKREQTRRKKNESILQFLLQKDAKTTTKNLNKKKKATLQGINISHLGKTNYNLQNAIFGGICLVSWRVQFRRKNCNNNCTSLKLRSPSGWWTSHPSGRKWWDTDPTSEFQEKFLMESFRAKMTGFSQ